MLFNDLELVNNLRLLSLRYIGFMSVQDLLCILQRRAVGFTYKNIKDIYIIFL